MDASVSANINVSRLKIDRAISRTSYHAVASIFALSLSRVRRATIAFLRERHTLRQRFVAEPSQMLLYRDRGFVETAVIRAAGGMESVVGSGGRIAYFPQEQGAAPRSVSR
jgi:hypothetical protein